MKRSTVFLVIALFALTSIPVLAQHMGYHSHQGRAMNADSTVGMMGNHNGMHNGMMNNRGNMHYGNMGNMQGMNHQYMNMMNNYPMMHNTMMLVNRLPQMQDALSLTDDQVDELQGMQEKFNEEQNDLYKMMEKKRTDLNTLVDNDAPVSKFRKAFKEIQGVRADMVVHAYETGRKMKSVLNSKQQKELQSTMPGNMMSNSMYK